MKLGVAVAAILALGTTLGIYADLARDAGWVLDDVPAVLENPLAHWPPEPLPLLQSPWFGPAPRWSLQGVSRPLATLSFAVEDGLHLRLATRHLVSIGLAALAAALLAALVVRLGALWRVPMASSTAAGVVAGVAFAALPAHAEAVMAISNRPEALAACLLLLAAHALLQREAAGLLAALALALALLAKESALAGLAPLALIAVVVPGRTKREAAALVGGLLVICVAWAAMRLAWVPAPTIAREDNPLWDAALDERWRAGLWLVWHAAQRLVTPDLLAPDYSFDALPLLAPPATELAAGAAIALVALAGLAVALARLLGAGWDAVGHSAEVSPTTASLALGLLTAAAFWAPVSQLIVPASLVTADRLLWLPSLGLCALLGAAVGGAWSPVEQRWRLRRSGAARSFDDATGPRRLLLALALSAAVALGLALAIPATRAVAADWQSEDRLFVRGARLQPRSVKMRYNLGRLLLERGAAGAALEQLRAARDIAPTDRAVAVLALQAATRSDACTLGAVWSEQLLAAGDEDAARVAVLDDAMRCKRFDQAWQAGRGIRRADAELAQRVYVAAIAAGEDALALQWARDHGVDADSEPRWVAAACWADDHAGRPDAALRRLLALRARLDAAPAPDAPAPDLRAQRLAVQVAHQISRRCELVGAGHDDPALAAAAALCAEQWRQPGDGGTGARDDAGPPAGRGDPSGRGGRANGDP